MNRAHSYRSGAFFGRRVALREENQNEKGIVRAFRGACFSPLAWLLVFYSLVVHLRLVTGVWPYSGADEAFDAGCDLHALAAALAFMALLVSPISVLTFLATRPGFFLARRDCRNALWLFALTSPATYLLARFDPGLFFAWFMD